MWGIMNKINNKGLTLIEIMIVVTILSIITAVLYAVFDTTTKCTRQGNAATEVFQNARSVLELMAREMAAAFCSVTDDVYGMKFTGTSQVDFTCVFRASAIYEVGYCLSGNTVYRREAWPDGNGGSEMEKDNSMSLIPSESGTTIGGNRYQEIAFGVQTLDFRYMEAISSAGLDFTSGTKTFNSTSAVALPYAVRITITLDSEEKTGGSPIIDDKTFQTVVYIPGK